MVAVHDLVSKPTGTEQSGHLLPRLADVGEERLVPGAEIVQARFLAALRQRFVLVVPEAALALGGNEGTKRGVPLREHHLHRLRDVVD